MANIYLTYLNLTDIKEESNSSSLTYILHILNLQILRRKEHHVAHGAQTDQVKLHLNKEICNPTPSRHQRCARIEEGEILHACKNAADMT